MKTSFYEPFVVDNPKGLGYSFYANEEVTYFLFFNKIDTLARNSSDLANTACYLMEFSHSEGKLPPEYNKARDTISSIVLEFFRVNPEAVIFGVYDDTKVSDKVRFRLLNYWFNKYNTKAEFQKVNILTGEDNNEIVSLLFRADNAAFLNLVR